MQIIEKVYGRKNVSSGLLISQFRLSLPCSQTTARPVRRPRLPPKEPPRCNTFSCNMHPDNIAIKDAVPIMIASGTDPPRAAVKKLHNEQVINLFFLQNQQMEPKNLDCLPFLRLSLSKYRM